MQSHAVRLSDSSVDLLCEAVSGDPPISYHWTDPNGQALSPGGISTDGRVSFTLASYGNYTCTADNKFGVDRSTVELLEPGKAKQNYFWFSCWSLFYTSTLLPITHNKTIIIWKKKKCRVCQRLPITHHNEGKGLFVSLEKKPGGLV